ncbi:MAG: hypothetical protein WCB85_04445 [Candidatus Dormiibacterota bacterium]
MLLGVAVSACGAVSTAVMHGATPRTVVATSTPSVVATPGLAEALAAPFSTSPPTSTPVPAPAESCASPSGTQVVAGKTAAGDLVVDSPLADGDIQVSILNAHGAVLASTTVPEASEWTVVSGGGGAYWLDGTEACRLEPNGTVSALGSVPSGVDQVLVSPDGTEYAYATSESNNADTQTVNSIYLAQIGGSPSLAAQRVWDSSNPSADAPAGGWMYGLISWTSQGIVLRREATGGCGCGAFDMEMLAGYSALFDPSTGTTTDLTADDSCPLSGVGPGAVAACFDESASDPGDGAIEVLDGGKVSTHFSLSGQSLGADAVFSPDGSTLAYATLPAADDQCGSDWQSLTTLRILGLRSGTEVSGAGAGLQPVAWTATGVLYATETGNKGAVSVVSVDRASGAATPLWAGASGARLIGVDQ